MSTSISKKKNGVKSLRIHSLNGVYEVSNQQYVLKDGSTSSHLELIHGSSTHYTSGLATFLLKWASCLGYTKLSDLLVETTGCHVLSATGIKDFILRKALQISCLWSDSGTKLVDLVANETDLNIAVPPCIDIYTAEQGEIILMMDDVGVKAQKPHKQIERVETDTKRIDTTVALISAKKQFGQVAAVLEDICIDLSPNVTPNETVQVDKVISPSYIPLTEGINEQGQVVYPIKYAIYDLLHKVYLQKDPTDSLPIVAITDGARTIRLTLQSLFGMQVTILLDWYHLQLKIKNLMSMIAINKTLKVLYIKELSALLWRGKSMQAIEYIRQIPQVKNQEKCQELVTYIEKHQAEIIDYKMRQQVGKTIGSGRCEKANDLIVAYRQKNKGMAWSKPGSKALAIIKTHQLQQNIQHHVAS